MNRIVTILMERDQMSQQEAEQRLAEVREQCIIAPFYEVTDIIMDELYLEPDYMMDLFE